MSKKADKMSKPKDWKVGAPKPTPSFAEKKAEEKAPDKPKPMTFIDYYEKYKDDLDQALMQVVKTPLLTNPLPAEYHSPYVAPPTPMFSEPYFYAKVYTGNHPGKSLGIKKQVSAHDQQLLAKVPDSVVQKAFEHHFEAFVMDLIKAAQSMGMAQKHKAGIFAINNMDWNYHGGSVQHEGKVHYDTSTNEVLKFLAEAFHGVTEKTKCPVTTPVVTHGNPPPFPCGFNHAAPVYDVIMHLNDHHKWTREAIADWLDELDIDTTMKEEVNNP